MGNKLKFDDTHWLRRPKSPKENHIVTLENTNNIQDQTLVKKNTQTTLQQMEWTNQIIDIIVMKICISNTMIEFDPSEKRKRGGVVLTLVAPVLIRLLNVYFQPWLLQCNQRTIPDQLIWITIIHIKGWYKQNNNNLNCKDAEAKQGSSDSYRALTWSITKCNKSKWYFAHTWGWRYGSKYYSHK